MQGVRQPEAKMGWIQMEMREEKISILEKEMASSRQREEDKH